MTESLTFLDLVLRPVADALHLISQHQEVCGNPDIYCMQESMHGFHFSAGLPIKDETLETTV